MFGVQCGRMSVKLCLLFFPLVLMQECATEVRVWNLVPQVEESDVCPVNEHSSSLGKSTLLEL